MTKDEIKSTYTMTDILARYGLRANPKGFISCPFHKERTASMKIYKDSYYCFGCGAAGDIFTFVQEMENISFKDAFIELGGVYQKHSFSSDLALYKARKLREMKQKEKEREELQKKANMEVLEAFRNILNRSEPLSDTWCDAFNGLQKQLYIHGELNGIPY